MEKPFHSSDFDSSQFLLTIFSLFLFVFRLLALLSAIYAASRSSEIRASWIRFIEGIRATRLIREDEGVEGSAWFSKERSSKWHLYANVLRVASAVLFAPFYVVPPHIISRLSFLLHDTSKEQVCTFDAVLATSASEGTVAEYQPNSFHPRWLLKVEFRPNATPQYEQVTWSEDIRTAGYTAMSYPVKSAFKLFREAGRSLQDPSPFSKGRRWSLRDRQRIAEQVLFEYAVARNKATQLESEYIWLDEFCLSDKQETDPEAIQEQRTLQLGRLADIFRGALKVVVFCHERDCDHSNTNCPWGSRIFSLSEILHATRIVRMTRSAPKRTGPLQTHLYNEPARLLRRAIQLRAESDKQWHLQAVMQNAGTSDAFSRQDSIHSLLVEAIRRDDAGNFRQHNLLGKSLNGLLPRRAKLGDLQGKDGWADLSWLLELNQGFYNAASLAAVSSMKESDAESEDNGDSDSVVVDFPIRHPWLGKPILPSPGLERLHPMVMAYPVRNPESDGAPSALNIVGPTALPVYHTPRRDPNGFYHNSSIEPLRDFCLAVFLCILWIDVDVLLFKHWHLAMIIFWIDSVFYSIVRLLAGTMYLVKDGWVYLEDAQWGEHPQESLCIQDPELGPLVHWGNPDKRPVPKWHASSDSRAGSLVDLQNKVYTKVHVTSTPNAMVPLAIHGSGITCMLIDRADDPSTLCERVGMANLPPYALGQGKPTSSICIGGKSSRAREKSPLEHLLLRSAKLHMALARHFNPSALRSSRIGRGAQGLVAGAAKGPSKTVHFEDPTKKDV